MGHSNDIIEGIDLSDPKVIENLRRMPTDRDLTPREVSLLERGKMLDGKGNGEYTSLADVPKDTLLKYQEIGLRVRQHNIAAKKLEEKLAYLQAHREHAATILGARLSIIEGLLREMVSPETGLPDTSRLDEKRLKVLSTALNDFEKAGGMGGDKSSGEAQKLDINVTHLVSNVVKSLGGGA